MRDKNGPGKYDRRLELSKLSTVTDDFNEPLTELTVMFRNYPACRIEKTSSDDEDVKGNQVQSILTIDWDIRYIPTLDIDTNWQIKDIHDGKIYKIVAPPAEIGRRQGIMLKTERVQ